MKKAYGQSFLVKIISFCFQCAFIYALSSLTSRLRTDQRGYLTCPGAGGSAWSTPEWTLVYFPASSSSSRCSRHCTQRACSQSLCQAHRFVVSESPQSPEIKTHFEMRKLFVIIHIHPLLSKRHDSSMFCVIK